MSDFNRRKRQMLLGLIIGMVMLLISGWHWLFVVNACDVFWLLLFVLGGGVFVISLFLPQMLEPVEQIWFDMMYKFFRIKKENNDFYIINNIKSFLIKNLFWILFVIIVCTLLIAMIIYLVHSSFLALPKYL